MATFSLSGVRKFFHLESKVKIDLAAERLIAAERGEEKIAVEIKSFIGTIVYEPVTEEIVHRNAAITAIVDALT